MKKILGLALMVLFIASNCFAMSFSQPEQIGSIGYINIGGFIFKQVSLNKGVLSNIQRNKNNPNIYDHGIARFGDGEDALYLHYDAYKANVQGKNVNVISKGFTKFGSNDVKNTLNISILQPDIFKISSNEGITIYSINDSYDLTVEFRYILIGRLKNGTWVKYLDTYELAEKYFGKNQDHWFKKLNVNNDTISIYYELFSNGNYRNPTGKGEFRFKWDESAQWFGVEHIVY